MRTANIASGCTTLQSAWNAMLCILRLFAVRVSALYILYCFFLSAMPPKDLDPFSYIYPTKTLLMTKYELPVVGVFWAKYNYISKRVLQLLGSAKIAPHTNPFYGVNKVRVKNITVTASRTRGNKCKLAQHRYHYVLRKYYFTNKLIPIWNSLSNHVVSAETINTFKNRLDTLWSDQDVLSNYKVDLHGTRNRSITV